MIRDLNINQFNYELPNDRIALYPLEKRDESKLLIYKKAEINHDKFSSLPNHIPSNCTLFFNNTKVIPARIYFHKETGAVIEVFLLNPVGPSAFVIDAMQSNATCTWKCAIGNSKRWQSNQVLKKKLDHNLLLEAELISREEGIVKFTWNLETLFAEVLNLAGDVPLPPYLKRESKIEDKERYQTIYSSLEGAVAAPTAGLHFTDDVLNSLKKKGTQFDFLTLHVSSGTFQPIKTQKAADHKMHKEQILITKKNLENLLLPEQFIIAVGTTSLRTLESLYWYGVKLLQDPKAEFIISQDDANCLPNNIPVQKAIEAVLNKIENHNLTSLTGETSIFIMPEYRFRICKGLITNFHQPGSTLMLLVAAFVGNDWKNIYQEALQKNYRFLSYGDSSLLLP